MKRILLLFLLLVFTRGSALPAQAEDFNGFTVSSMILNLQGKPGETVQTTFVIANRTKETAQLHVAVRDFDWKENKIIYRDDVPADHSVAKWSKVSFDDAQLAPNQSTKAHISVAIPKEAQPAERSSLISVTFTPPDTAAGAATAKIATELLPVLYVTATNAQGVVQLKHDWQVSELNVNKGEEKTTLSFDAKNLGNAHLESSGTFVIRNVFGGEELKAPIGRFNLLPQAQKTITGTLPHLGFGVYKASMEVGFDPQHIVKQETTLYVIPWLPVSIGAAVLLALVLLFCQYRSKQKKSILKEETVS